MRIFIVGATGVLGKALLPLLQQQGHTIRALVRTPEKVQQLQSTGIDAREGDLLASDVEQQVLDMMTGCDAAIHIATAIPQDSAASGAWGRNTQLRTEGTRRLLRATLATGVKRYIQQSIVMAYPDGGDEWIYENTPLDASPERRSLCGPVIDMEDMVRDIAREQLQWCILRGGLFVGPGTGQDRVIASLRAGTTTIPCDGTTFVSLIHVADMATAVSSALTQAPAGTLYNVVDEPIRSGDYLSRLATLIGTKQPEQDYSNPCPPSQRCSNQAARGILSWEPTHGIWPEVK